MGETTELKNTLCTLSSKDLLLVVVHTGCRVQLCDDIRPSSNIRQWLAEGLYVHKTYMAP